MQVQSKVVTVRMPEFLIEHCKRRVDELSRYHDMDISKFIRWLIKKDFGQNQDDKNITPSYNVTHPPIDKGGVCNTASDNNKQQQKIQKPQPKKLDWSHLK